MSRSTSYSIGMTFLSSSRSTLCSAGSRITANRVHRQRTCAPILAGGGRLGTICDDTYHLHTWDTSSNPSRFKHSLPDHASSVVATAPRHVTGDAVEVLLRAVTIAACTGDARHLSSRGAVAFRSAVLGPAGSEVPARRRSSGTWDSIRVTVVETGGGLVAIAAAGRSRGLPGRSLRRR